MRDSFDNIGGSVDDMWEIVDNIRESVNIMRDSVDNMRDSVNETMKPYIVTHKHISSHTLGYKPI